MNVILRRRQLVVATLIIALGAAVFVNWYFSGDAGKLKTAAVTTEPAPQTLGEAKYVSATEKAEDVFAAARMKRQKEEDAAVEKLQAAFEKAESNSDEANTLADKLALLTDRSRTETDTETLITAKIGTPCVVILSEKGADVLVPKGTVTEDGALRICEIVNSAAGISPSEITITETK